jgi:hypothetical protein
MRTIIFSLTVVLATVFAPITTNANASLFTGNITQIDDIFIVVDQGGGEIEAVEIINLNGGVVFEASGCYAQSCQFEVPGLSSGNYIAVVKTTYGVWTQQFFWR